MRDGIGGRAADGPPGGSGGTVAKGGERGVEEGAPEGAPGSQEGGEGAPERPAAGRSRSTKRRTKAQASTAAPEGPEAPGARPVDPGDGAGGQASDADAVAAGDTPSAPAARARSSRSSKRAVPRASAARSLEAAEDLVPPEGPGADPDGSRRDEARAGAAEDSWPEAGEEWVDEVEAAYLQSKYTLVSVAAKRARQLLAGGKRRVDSLSEKPVTVALEELGQGKLYFERTREGIK